MINLKVKREETKGQDVAVNPSPEGYGYGTRITFDKETLKKVGIDVGKYNVGDKMEASVNIEVVSVRQSKQSDGNDSSMELQITDIDLGDVKDATPIEKKISKYKAVRNEYPTQEG
jgi:hypothetical protein